MYRQAVLPWLRQGNMLALAQPTISTNPDHLKKAYNLYCFDKNQLLKSSMPF